MKRLAFEVVAKFRVRRFLGLFWPIFATTSFVFVVLLGACSGPSQVEDAKVARLNIAMEPDSLDPHQARDMSSLMVVRMLFEGLTRIAPDDRPELALAEKVSISPDQKEYTFSLRPAVWSDGKAVTAHDFVYAYQRILSPNFPSSTAFQLYVLKNAKQVKEGKALVTDLGVHALDEHTLKISLEQPTPYLLELLSLPCFFPVPKNLDQKNPKWAENKDSYVSNGPFMLAEWKHEDALLLKKNPGYWEEKKVHLQGLHCVMVRGETEVQMFENNELDWAGSPFSILPVDAIPEFKKQGILQSKEMLGTTFLRVNQTSKALRHPLIRKALSCALNREALTEHVTQGGQLPAYHLVPPSFHLRGKPIPQQHQAREWLLQGLKELGIPLARLPKIHLMYRSGERNHLTAQTIQEQWRSVLGIQIELEAIEGNVYYDRISKLNYDLALGSWIADFNDPINFLEVFKFKNAGSNNTGWENCEYRRLLDDSGATCDQEKRRDLLAQAEDLLLEEAPVIPLYHSMLLYLVREGIHNVVVSPLGGVDFKWVEKKEDKR